MKKTTSKQVMLYVLLLGALLLVAVYFLVYTKYTDEAEAIRSSNIALNERVNVLSDYYAHMDEYQQETERIQGEIRGALEVFPSDVREEDMIALALDTMETASVDYSAISIGESSTFNTIPAETVQAASMEDLSEQLVFLQRRGTYSNNVSYMSLKNCIEAINNSSNRVSITNFVYSGDAETGELSGSIEVSFYYVMGTNKEYVPQDLAEYESGLFNLFRATISEGNE